METKLIKTDQDGNITAETQTITGVAETELSKTDKWKQFEGFLIERTEKVIHGKDGKPDFKQVIFNDTQDDRGMQLNLETFSPTDDAIIAQLMEGKEKIKLYYEIVTNDYGTKFRIKAIQLPDGTWSAPKAKDSWKKGNATNNRAVAMQAAAGLYSELFAVVKPAERKSIIDEVISCAEAMYEWIKLEAK